MTGFCHECGAPRAEDGIFCEQCGTSLRPRRAVGRPAPPDLHQVALKLKSITKGVTWTPPAIKLSRPLLMRGALGLVAVCAVGGGLWWALAPKPAMPSQLMEGARPWLTQGALQVVQRPCLTNFDYRMPAPLVSPNASDTLNWLDGLVKAGLYSGPEQVNTGNNWQPTLLRYVKTPEGTAQTEGGRLCAASRLEAVSVEFDPKQEQVLGGVRVQAGSITLRWQDRAAWSGVSPYKEHFDHRFSEVQQRVFWRAEDKGWRLISDTEFNQLLRSEQQRRGDDGGLMSLLRQWL